MSSLSRQHTQIVRVALADFAASKCRLDLATPASIRQDSECSGITVSEAEWPNGSVKDFEGCTHCYADPPAFASADDGFLPAPPYEDPVEVK